MPNLAEKITLSVIVPTFNAAGFLEVCLASILRDNDPHTELIVVDDGSTDGSADIARRLGAQVIVLEKNRGPGPARNAGAREASGDILVFVDSDVLVRPGTLGQLRDFLRHHSTSAAVFGSYDAAPAAPNLLSQYRNLLHHFTHQSSPHQASHFWSGLGAVRREAYWATGGFDEGGHAERCDDIEFGYRLRDHGYLIHMAPEIQGTHLKVWRLWNMVRTDVWLRAIPWVHLLLARKEQPKDFSLSQNHRLSVLLAGLVALALLPALFIPAALLIAVLGILAFIVVNRGFLQFLLQVRGYGFAFAVIPVHLFHGFYSGVGAFLGILTFYLGHRITPLPRYPPTPPRQE